MRFKTFHLAGISFVSVFRVHRPEDGWRATLLRNPKYKPFSLTSRAEDFMVHRKSARGIIPGATDSQFR